MLPSIDDPEILCFKKCSNKDATQIVGGVVLILSLLILIFMNSLVNFVVIGLILFVASILLIVGVRKGKTWMFLPFLWSLSGSIFLNPISFVICIYFYYTYRNSWMYEFQTSERRAKYHTTVLITAF
uniref:Uncharacterized protein n=1 Tax=Panagrolaimus superbus TaxID=310955 RepID=A0A914YIM2_9BILA